MLKGEQTDKLNSNVSQRPHGYICKGLEGIWKWSGWVDSKNVQAVIEVRYTTEGLEGES